MLIWYATEETSFKWLDCILIEIWIRDWEETLSVKSLSSLNFWYMCSYYPVCNYVSTNLLPISWYLCPANVARVLALGSLRAYLILVTVVTGEILSFLPVITIWIPVCTVFLFKIQAVWWQIQFAINSVDCVQVRRYNQNYLVLIYFYIQMFNGTLIDW